MKAPITVGSKVKYSRVWLKSIGTITGDMPFARGTVTALSTLPTDIPLTIATIDWDNTDLPARVNVENLVLAADQETSSI